jgi:hypothetical protein
MFSDTTSLVPGGLNGKFIQTSPVFKAIKSFPLWNFWGASEGWGIYRRLPKYQGIEGNISSKAGYVTGEWKGISSRYQDM